MAFHQQWGAACCSVAIMTNPNCIGVLQVPDGPDGQTAEMRAGDMMVVKYTTVARLVQSGQVTLV